MKYAAMYRSFSHKMREELQEQIQRANRESIFGLREAVEDAPVISQSSNTPTRQSQVSKRKSEGQFASFSDTSMNDAQKDALSQDRLPIEDPSFSREKEQAFRGGGMMPMDQGSPDMTIQKFADGSVGGSVSGSPGGAKQYSGNMNTTLQWARDVKSGKNQVPDNVRQTIAGLMDNYETFKNDKGDSARMAKERIASQIAELQAQSSGGGDAQASGGEQSQQSKPTFNPDLKPSDFTGDEDPGEVVATSQDTNKNDDQISGGVNSLYSKMRKLTDNSYLDDDEQMEFESLVRSVQDIIKKGDYSMVKPENIKKLLQATRAFERVNDQREDDYFDELVAKLQKPNGGRGSEVDFKEPDDFDTGENILSTEPGGPMVPTEKPGEMSKADTLTYALRKATASLSPKQKAKERMDRDPEVNKVRTKVEDPIDVEAKETQRKDRKTDNVAKAARKSKERKEKGETTPRSSVSKEKSETKEKPRKKQPKMRILGTRAVGDDRSSDDQEKGKSIKGSSSGGVDPKKKMMSGLAGGIGELKRKIRQLAMKRRNKSLSDGEKQLLTRQIDDLQKKIESLGIEMETQGRN